MILVRGVSPQLLVDSIATLRQFYRGKSHPENITNTPIPAQSIHQFLNNQNPRLEKTLLLDIVGELEGIVHSEIEEK